MSAVESVVEKLELKEMELLRRLRAGRRRKRLEHHDKQLNGSTTAGARIADAVAATMGSWPFIIVQSILLAVWIVLNVTAWVKNWDPYPFILLNLALSFQAAYAAPFIMMSQNRQATIDRQAAQHDYDTNTKAELEIELLHHKMDELRDKEIKELIAIIHNLEARLLSLVETKA